jgi:putative Ca2+/H+ antiporter (TMEM165/GDT1 family)
VVAGLFLAGSGYAWWMASHERTEEVTRDVSGHGAVLTAFVVIFLAEWGDLTQILTANLAARYRAPFPVAVGSTLALWAVAGLAVAGGQALLRLVKISTVRRVTAVALLVLAGYTAWAAAR